MINQTLLLGVDRDEVSYCVIIPIQYGWLRCVRGNIWLGPDDWKSPTEILLVQFVNWYVEDESGPEIRGPPPSSGARAKNVNMSLKWVAALRLN